MTRPTPTLRIFLVRHGEVEANRTFAFVGRSDDLLTAEGHTQARELGLAFGGMGVDRLISSPLQRCVATAQSIGEAVGQPVVEDERAIEQGFGEWEGLDRSQIENRGKASAEQWREWQRDPSTAPPGGEALSTVQARILALFEELARAGTEAAVIVSHVGPIKSAVCGALGVPLSSVGRFFLDPASICVVDWYPRRLVRALNVHAASRWQLARWQLSR